MDGYIYNASLLCKTCGEKIKVKILEDKSRELGYVGTIWKHWNEQMCDTLAGLIFAGSVNETEIDSGIWPQACDVSGEADTPQHCYQCDKFLENALTDAGREYVQEAFNESIDREAEGFTVVRSWADFYGISAEEK